MIELCFTEPAPFGDTFRMLVTAEIDGKIVNYPVECKLKETITVPDEVWAKLEKDFEKYFVVKVIKTARPVTAPQPVAKPAEPVVVEPVSAKPKKK